MGVMLKLTPAAEQAAAKYGVRPIEWLSQNALVEMDVMKSLGATEKDLAEMKKMGAFLPGVPALPSVGDFVCFTQSNRKDHLMLKCVARVWEVRQRLDSESDVNYFWRLVLDVCTKAEKKIQPVQQVQQGQRPEMKL